MYDYMTLLVLPAAECLLTQRGIALYRHSNRAHYFQCCIAKFIAGVNVVLTCRYEEDMTVQFSKCQEAELARMEFFKAIFVKMQGILDLTKTDR